MNVFTGVVRLTKDPELKYAQSGTAVVNFTGAVDKYNAKKLKEEGKNSANFIPMVAFGKKAEVLAQYLQKGSQVAISGAIDTDSYEKDGQRHFVWKVIINDFTFCGVGSGNKQQNDQQDDFIDFDDSSDQIQF